MRDLEPVRDAAGVLDVLARATGAFASDRLAMIVELERDADDIVALAFSRAATTDESTPPDMATTTRVSAGRPSKCKLLSTGGCNHVTKIPTRSQ